MPTNNILANLLVRISANTAEFLTGLSASQKGIKGFISQVKSVAGAVGVAFGVQQISSFAIEVSRLSGEAEAVGAAFRRLPESTRLMSELKSATGGTVSELDLMKRAVQASNFDISLGALPRLLEFATLRAQQTGQSVDYLVDSIVTGIGRKSKLILDNLGISALQLDKALGGVSVAAASVGEVADAVGKIAEENLKNMEGFAENASTKIQRLAASWENVKVAAGDAANSTGFLGKTINGLTRFLDALSGDEFTTGLNQLLSRRGSDILEKFASMGGRIDLSWQELLERGFVKTEAAARKYEKVLADIAEKQKALSHIPTVDIDPVTGLPTSGGKSWDPSLAQQHIVSLDTLKKKEEELLAIFKSTDTNDKKKLENTSAQIIAIREQIKALEDLLKVEEKFTLSQTAQRAMAGPSFDKVSTFGELITKVTKEGGVLQNFKGVAGEKTPLSDPLPVDLDKMEIMAQRMVDLRNESLKTKTEMVQHWIDLSGVVSSAIGNMADSLGSALVGMEDFGSAIIQTFAGFAREFGSMLIASGVAALALEKLITNPVAAIAAGAALVAIAGMASSALQRSHAGMMGGGSRGGDGGNAVGSGRIEIGGRIRGYDLAVVTDKNNYRRSRAG